MFFSYLLQLISKITIYSHTLEYANNTIGDEEDNSKHDHVIRPVSIMPVMTEKEYFRDQPPNAESLLTSILEMFVCVLRTAEAWVGQESY